MDDIDDVAGGNDRRSRALRDDLHRLADGPGPLLREMATAVLRGAITLRDTAASTPYGQELTCSFRSLWERHEKVSPQERDDLAARATQSRPAQTPTG